MRLTLPTKTTFRELRSSITSTIGEKRHAKGLFIYKPVIKRSDSAMMPQLSIVGKKRNVEESFVDEPVVKRSKYVTPPA